MNGRSQRRRCPTWSNLPTEILRSIAKLLQDDIFSLRHFRLVCKKWNYSTTISALLPQSVNTYGFCYLFSSTVYLVNSSWIVLLAQPMKDTYRYCQLFTRSSFDEFPTNFDLNQFQSRQLGTECYLSSNPMFHDLCPYVKTLVYSPKSLSSISDCALLGLRKGGKLVGYPPFEHHLDNDEDCVRLRPIQISYDSINEFDDIVEFKGMILTVDRQGKLYEIDPYTLEITGADITKGICTSSAMGFRKRLVATSAGKLYLLVRQYVRFKPSATTQFFKVYELSEKCKLREWAELKTFGNRVLFVTQDCCFFVGVDGLCGGEMGQSLKNCMVYSKLAFPKYTRNDWCDSISWDGSCSTVSRYKDEVGVFNLNGDGEDGSFRSVSSFQNFPFVLDSCPSWVHQSPTSTSHFRSQRESEEDDSERQEDESNHEMAQDEEELPNIRNWDDEFDSNHGIDNNQVPESESNTEVTPVMSYRSISLAEQQGSSRGANVESVTRAWACIASASKGSQGDSSKLNFRGLNICMELVPILEKIWSKHGDVMEKIAIRNGDIVARTLESLANAVQILEENTGRSLNDEQAIYLSSTLDDLQLMRYRVDWLAPKIKDAVAHNKSKHLMGVFDSLKGITQFKAQISERRSKLLEEVAKYDQMEKELDSEIAKMHESVPSLAQDLDFDKPLGGLI